MNRFDYIIVGAGSAGCALAYRLSARPDCQVLLLESGGLDLNPFIHIPRGFAKILEGDTLLHRYAIDHTGYEGKQEEWVRGKVLGGSSSVNGQVYMRGFAADYDALGIPGWSWKEVGAAMREFENHELGAAEYRGDSGPLRVSQHPNRSAICDAFIHSAELIGAPYCEDLNDVDEQGAGYQPRTIYKGFRQSAARAFLHPIRHRKNLTIKTHCDVQQLILENQTATGVRTNTRNGAQVDFYANREVILSAGAIASPLILQRSGIGDAAALQSLGIPVQAHSPLVGKNLIEHRCVMPTYRVSHGSLNSALRPLGLTRTLLTYLLRRDGPMAYSAFEASALVKTSANLPRANAQIGFTPVSVDRHGTKVTPDREPGVLACSYLIKPKSRGYLRIQSADARQAPYIQPNYLAHEDDQRDAVDLFRLTRQLFASSAMAPYQPREMSPGADVVSDSDIIDYYLQKGSTALHATGTCQMGLGDDAVLDEKLRVKGIAQLRVADLSVFPDMVSGNTNAPAMAVGWRAADFILENS